MRHRTFSGSLMTTASVAWLALACQGGGSAGSITGSTPTVAVAASAGATPTVTAFRPGVAPPDASLAAEGGDPVVGELGSFTWLDGGSDSPWLPGAPAEVGSGEPLTVTVDDDVTVVDWAAKRVPAGATDGTRAGLLGEGGPPVTFAAPGRGAWSVQVTVRFGGDLGSASYYWRLTVR